MHIPDGFLTIEISVLFWIISFIVVSFSFKNLKKNSKKIVLFGLGGTVIFLAQMFNFPVLGGTSGHLLLGGLLALLIGFDSAVIITASVLFIQAFIFHDGGILALGANVFNMAVAAPFIAVKTKELIKSNYSVIIAGLLSVVTASVLVSLQLFFSGTTELIPVLNSMISIHLIIGLIEGIFSFGVYYVLINKNISLKINLKKIALVSLIIALIAVPFASALPDGLEKTAEVLEFDELALNSMTPITLMADYLFPGITNKSVSVLLAGLTGTIITFSFILILMKTK